jgi:hypothetical protein
VGKDVVETYSKDIEAIKKGGKVMATIFNVQLKKKAIQNKI